MAIYHLSTNTVSRGKGKSVIGACAYRTASKMYCERTGTHHDYTRKQGVIYTGDFVLDASGIIQTTDDRHKLWNSAETAETRKDGRTGREIIINLPHELPEQQRQALAVEFTQTIIRKYKVAATVAIHAPDADGDQRNHHAHILMTTREVTLDIDKNFVFGDKTDLELSNTKLKKQGKKITQEQIKDIRHSWAIHCNRALENNGIDARIDHRSHADRGLEQLPSIKMGHFATEMERKGITTARGDKNRAIKEYNVSLDEIAAIKAEPPPAQPRIPSADEFELSFAQTPAPKPKPAPAPAKPAQPIVHHAPPPQPQTITMPASFFYSDGRDGVSAMAEIGYYGRFVQGGQSLGHASIHEFDSRSMLRTTITYDAASRTVTDIQGLDSYLRERIPRDAEQRQDYAKRMHAAITERARFIQDNGVGDYAAYIQQKYRVQANIHPSWGLGEIERQPQHHSQPQHQNSYDYDR